MGKKEFMALLRKAARPVPKELDKQLHPKPVNKPVRIKKKDKSRVD